ncbi:MAG: 4-hydroxy-tetrahydrodipicolinate synthase [Nitrospirae bacterium]|nr:MAG: 4-hydroxy-tetrahydrodipicolinate synthase [Nitrospirota bacterium]
MDIRGSMVALITPFTDAGGVDEEALRRLVEFHVEQGSHALVPCGTTGESATLTHEEHREVIRIVVEQAAGRIPVIGGTGSNSTAESIELTRYAKEVGCDAALLISPYYNKPSQDGVYLHYKRIAEETAFPLIVYNVPGRTALNILPETVARLARVPGIVGIKEATANLQQIAEVIDATPEGFALISGDDATTFPTLCLGGVGTISVVANVAPRDMAALCDAWFAGEVEEARRLHYRTLPLSKVLFIETNPVPVKEACHLLGFCRPHLRLPLTRLAEANRERLRAALADYGLL